MLYRQRTTNALISLICVFVVHMLSHYVVQLKCSIVLLTDKPPEKSETNRSYLFATDNILREIKWSISSYYKIMQPLHIYQKFHGIPWILIKNFICICSLRVCNIWYIHDGGAAQGLYCSSTGSTTAETTTQRNYMSNKLLIRTWFKCTWIFDLIMFVISWRMSWWNKSRLLSVKQKNNRRLIDKLQFFVCCFVVCFFFVCLFFCDFDFYTCDLMTKDLTQIVNRW